MSLEDQKLMLQEHIIHMYDESYVDKKFNNFRVYRSAEEADKLLKNIELYCLEVNQEISQLESYSKLVDNDFLEATKIVRSIKARSIWIGARNMKMATFFVIDACLGFDEESFLQAICGLRNDFMSTKEKFETYMEMVREVVKKENEQKK